MTPGLDATPGTVLGDSGHQGGGAAGHELDSVNFKYGSPEHTLIVAKGIVIHPDYGWVNEDMLTQKHPLPQEDWACADACFFETPAGGAVFSVGSMTWAGSVPIPGTLRTLTTNVLKRFMDPQKFEWPE
jgi:N,N-dimethylformamidase